VIFVFGTLGVLAVDTLFFALLHDLIAPASSTDAE
jgi:hypothetical protein